MDSASFTSKLLPAEGREILRRAYEQHKNSTDDFAKQKALDAAIKKVRERFLDYFKQD